MAFSTRQELRERLNGQLGITDAEDAPWGTTEQRDSAIRWGLEQLEPAMMRLVEESVTVLADTREYTLTSRITKVAWVEQASSSGIVRDLTNYRSVVIDSDPPATRLTFPRPLDLSSTLKVVGYAPYLSNLATDATECDIPQDIEWIPLLGAAAELYRRRFHEWLDFERYTASNPTTVLDPQVLYRAYTDALGRFEQAKLDHYRRVSMPRRQRLARG